MDDLITWSAVLYWYRIRRCGIQSKHRFLLCQRAYKNEMPDWFRGVQSTLFDTVIPEHAPQIFTLISYSTMFPDAGSEEKYSHTSTNTDKHIMVFGTCVIRMFDICAAILFAYCFFSSITFTIFCPIHRSEPHTHFSLQSVQNQNNIICLNRHHTVACPAFHSHSWEAQKDAAKRRATWNFVRVLCANLLCDVVVVRGRLTIWWWAPWRSRLFTMRMCHLVFSSDGDVFCRRVGKGVPIPVLEC